MAIGVGLYYWLGASGESEVSDRFLTLWQLQAGLVSVALPILIFIIQYGGAETTARRSKTQALVHYTRVFPILVILVGVLVAYAAGTVWRGPNAFAVGVGMFIVSVMATIYAFLRLLHFAYHPESLERASVSLLKRRFEEDLESTVDERIGANLVRQVVQSLGGAYSVYFPDSDGYMSMRAKDTGEIADVHLGNLRGLVEGLRSSAMEDIQSADQDMPIDRAVDRDDKANEQPDVVFTKVYGDMITDRDRSVVHLRREAFAELGRHQLEQQLDDVLQIEEREE